jgi:hypothetical protein
MLQSMLFTRRGALRRRHTRCHMQTHRLGRQEVVLAHGECSGWTMLYSERKYVEANGAALLVATARVTRARWE